MTYPPEPGDSAGRGQSGNDPGGYPGYPGGSPGYPGGPAGYPGYPAYGAAPPTRMRGQRAIQVGAILIAIGVVLAIVGGVLANTNAYSKVNDFQRVAVKDRTGTVTFKHAGGYLAYYESDSVTNSTKQRIPLIPVRLTNQATGQTTTLTTTYGDQSDGRVKFLHYDHDGHKGLAMWQFHIDQPGRYGVELRNNTAADPDAVVAFGKSIAQGVVLGGVLVVVGVLLLIAGVIVLIVGFVKQRRHRRDLRAGYGGAQPAGWPQGGRQSWPPAGGQQPPQWPSTGDTQSGWPPPPDQPPR